MIQPRMQFEDDGRFAVLAVGEVLMDFVAPEASDLESAESFLRSPGGAPANVAVAAARLGARSAFVGSVGDDIFGSALADVLAREGVDISGLRRVPQRTTLAFVARNIGGIPDFVFYRGADAELRAEDIPSSLLARSSFVYASSMALMTEPSRDATLFAVEIAREAGVLVAVDPNLRPSSWRSLDAAREALLPLARSADVLKVNEEEARLLAQTRDLDEAIDQLADDETLLVVTLGADGCRWRLGSKSGSVSSPRVPIEDTTGAGDAFVGALITELAAAGFSPRGTAEMDIAIVERALRFACTAAAVSCARPGAMSALPDRRQVEALL